MLLCRYYELDYEDIVAGQPTRFKYTQVQLLTCLCAAAPLTRVHQVAPTDCGLTAEEILLLPDKTLNQFATLKHYAPYRDDAGKMGKKYTPRRWEYHKKHNGVQV